MAQNKLTATPAEIHVTYLQWHNHLVDLRANHRLPESALRVLSLLVEIENIGYGPGMVQPGTLGKWTVFYSLIEQGFGMTLAIIAANLQIEDVEYEMHRFWMRDQRLNPDDSDDLFKYHSRHEMTPDKFLAMAQRLDKRAAKRPGGLDQEIMCLESLLAESLGGRVVAVAGMPGERTLASDTYDELFLERALGYVDDPSIQMVVRVDRQEKIDPVVAKLMAKANNVREPEGTVVPMKSQVGDGCKHFAHRRQQQRGRR
jgi:hypothetical protein